MVQKEGTKANLKIHSDNPYSHLLMSDLESFDHVLSKRVAFSTEPSDVLATLLIIKFLGLTQ